MSTTEPSSAASSAEAPTPKPVPARASTPLSASTSTRSIPAMSDEGKVERDGRLYLPLPHPLVHDAKPGSWGAKINDGWLHLNYFLRGLYATGVEWGVSMMDLALEYPRVALVFTVVVGVTVEETMSEHPMLGNTVRYIMFSIDPDAAEQIYPEEANVSEADQAVDKLAAEIIEKSVTDYYASPEYQQLQLDVRAKMHEEVMQSVYDLAGIETTPLPVSETEPAEPVTPIVEPEPEEPASEPQERPEVPVELPTEPGPQ